MTPKRRIFTPEARNVLLLTAACFGMTVAGAQAIGPGPSESSTAPQVQQSAPAQPGTSPATVSPKNLATAFEKADTDKDGRLSTTEAEKLPEIARQFTQLDTNHDGFLSRREFNGARIG